MTAKCWRSRCRRISRLSRWNKHYDWEEIMTGYARLGVLALFLFSGASQAQVGEVVRIGVLADMSSLYSDLGGHGSVVAARLAVEDFGAAADRFKVEIISADHYNKPDVGLNIARAWIDVDKVD